MRAPEVIETIAGVRAALAPGEAVLVPTMGALHTGHLALVERARELSDRVVVSVFVNPLQFGQGEDLARYPRDLDADLAALAPYGVTVFAPSVEEMYPAIGRRSITVHAGPVGDRYEGASRPGHFDGVLTVVAKLLGVVRPSHAVFGKKDAQQLFLVDRMVRELDFDTRIVGVDIVRSDAGLALSSRNRYLDDAQARSALVLDRALDAAASAGTVAGARAAALATVAGEPGAELDYVAIVDPDSFDELGPDEPAGAREALALLAARVGPARLIDNRRFRMGGAR